MTLNGKDFVSTAPVRIHLDSVTSDVIATVPPSAEKGAFVMASTFTYPVSLPRDVPSGQHVLVATQIEHNMNGGNPARTLIDVGTPAAGLPGPVNRPVALVAASGLSTLDLALISLGVAAGVSLLAGSLSFMAASSGRVSRARGGRTTETG